MRSTTHTRVAAALAIVALLFTAGLGQIQADHVEPEFNDDNNPKCADLDASFRELKIEPPEDGTFSDGNLTVTINITDFIGDEPKVFDWRSDIGVDAVIAKGGNKGNYIYRYDPEETSDTNLTTPGEDSNAISHISFCYDLEPDVSVAKEPVDDVIEFGETASFNLTVTNHGPVEATNVTLNDTLPDTTNPWTVSGPDASDCTLTDGRNLTCDFGTLAVGATRNVTVSVDTTEDDAGLLENTAVVDADEDTDASNNEDSASIYVKTADVGIEKVALEDPIDFGDVAQFNLTVTSNGPDAAENVTLTDTLPATENDWSVSGPDAADCTLTDGHSLSCDFGTLPVDATREITVSVTTTEDDAGLLENTATVSSDFDTDASNDQDSANIYVKAADVGIEKVALEDPIVFGDVAAFNLTVISNGPDAAENVTLEDTLPATVNDWSVSGPDAAACTIPDGRNLTCDFGTLPVDATRNVTVSVDTTEDDAGLLENTATVSSDFDTDASNDQDSASVYVKAADVGVEKVALEDPIAFGDLAEFNLTVTSNGPDAAENVTLTDTLPATENDWTLSGPDASACTLADGRNLSCDLGTIPAGETREISVSVDTTENDAGLLENTATVSSDFDTDASNNEDSANIYVKAADVGVTKTAVEDPIVFGDVAAFNLTVTSNGPDAAENVTLTDTLPDTVNDWSVSGPDATACTISDGRHLSCDFGTIAVDGTREISVSVTTTADDAGLLENTATVSSDFDTDASNNEDSANIYVKAADVGVTKTAVEDPITVGDLAAFEIVVTSNGPDAAENVTLTDSLPATVNDWSVSGPDAADCAISDGRHLSCDFGTLAVDATREIGVSVDTTGGDVGTLDNLVTVDSDFDTNPDNDTDEAAITVLKAASETTTTPDDGTITLGETNRDHVTVTGDPDVGTPTGTVTFYACSPTELTDGVCATGGTQFDAQTLDDNGTAVSAPFTPDVAGTWCFRGEYSGDDNYNASLDASTRECFDVLKASSDTTTTPTDTTITLGDSVADQAEVQGLGDGFPTPTGNVTFYVCDEGVVPCSTGGTRLGEVTLDDSAQAVSPSFTPLATGTYCFRGEYSGDDNYNASEDSSTRECFDVLKASSTTVTTPTQDNITLGESIADEVRVDGLGGDFPTPTGTVTFYACSPTELTDGVCATGGTQFDAQTLDDNGTAVSAPFTPDVAGTWCFRGEYSGDDNYNASLDASTRECFDVERASPDIETTSHPNGDITPDTEVFDEAHVEGLGGGFPDPTGSVDFLLCGPAEVTVDGCPTNGDLIGSGTLDDTGNATSPTTVPVERPLDSPDPLGPYCWRAEYAGDGNYTPATHTDRSAECVTVRSPFSTLAKSVRVLPNGSFAEDIDAEPGDSLQYRLVYTNEGNADATNVTIVEEVHDRATFVECSDNCTVDDGTVTWDGFTVAPGETLTVTFTVQLDPVFPVGNTTLTNVASASSGEEDRTAESPPVEVDVPAEPELGLSKAADRTVAGYDETITYTLTYFNSGNAHARNAIIVEEVPGNTTFVGCSDNCTVDNGTIRWDVGTVPALTNASDPAGNVTLTVRVLAREDCSICNVATIDSPDEADGPVQSNEVCVEVGADPTRAETEGSAFGARIEDVTLRIDETLVTASTAQEGLGAQNDSDQLLDVLVPPSSGSILDADVIRASSVSSVTRDPARSRTVATTEVVGADILDGLVTASTIRGVATAEANGDGATVSTTGSAFEDLEVQGQPITDVAPNTRIDLPAETFGEDSYIMLRETTRDTDRTSQATGGNHSSSVTLNMIHVVITDHDPVTPGEQFLEIVVGHAEASSRFPNAPSCEGGLDQSVAGHAFVTELATDPSAAPVTHGFVEIPSAGGDEEQNLASVDEDPVSFGSASTSSNGTLDPDASRANSRSEVNGFALACSDTGCLAEATTIRAEVSSEADDATAESTGTTVLEDATVAGVDVCAQLGLGDVCRPDRNTTITIPEVGFVVLNEQIPADGADRSALTVRAMRIVVTVPDNPTGLAPGAEIIVGETHSGATFAV